MRLSTAAFPTLPQNASSADALRLLDGYQKGLFATTWREPFDTVITDQAIPAAAPSPEGPSAALPMITAAPAQRTSSTIQITQRETEKSLNKLATDTKTDYEIRMLQFARAAIFSLDYQTPELSDQEKNTKALNIFNLARIEILELDRITKLDPIRLDPSKESQLAARASYMSKLGESCKRAFSMLAAQLDSNYRKGEKQLKMAEQILTWHDGRMTQVNTSFFQEGNDSYEIKRTETPIPGLTDAQKDEYRKIRHDSTKPKWFKEIEKKHPLLAKYLKEQVANEEWGILEHTLPTTLRSVPGLANFTRTDTTITNLTTQASTTGFMYRSATPPPIDVKNRSERVRLTQLNIEQYIAVRFSANDLPQKNGKSVIAINSLLNEIFGEALFSYKDNNTRMIADIKKALKNIKGSGKYPNVEFIFTTTPINNWRNLWITLNSHNQNDDNQYIAYCKEKIKDQTLDTSQRALLSAAQTALEQLSDRVDYFGDLNLIRSALYEIIIPGVSGCKSAKDREGYKQDYAAALRVYYLAHDKFPDFKLPKYRRAKLIAKVLGYVGAVTAVMAGLMLLATLFATPLSAFIIIPAALPQIAILAATAGGLALTLLTSLFQFTFKRPDYDQRSDFMRTLRHIRLSGFGAFSSNANAPGVYGQKDEDISPSDLTNPRQGQKPYRGKSHKAMFIADKASFALTASLMGVAAYLLLHFALASVIGGVLSGLAAPVLVSIAVVALAYLAANSLADWLNYYRNPIDKKEATHIKAFKLAHDDEIKLAKGNKMKGKDPKIKPSRNGAPAETRKRVASPLRHITDSSQSAEPGAANPTALPTPSTAEDNVQSFHPAAGSRHKG